jgi:hypothetical protein
MAPKGLKQSKSVFLMLLGLFCLTFTKGLNMIKHTREYEAGYKAGLHGKELSDNPFKYAPNYMKSAKWEAGFKTAKELNNGT